MNRNFNTPPGCLSRDYDEREVECPECTGTGEILNDDCVDASVYPTRICPRCLGQGTLNASEIRPEER